MVSDPWAGSAKGTFVSNVQFVISDMIFRLWNDIDTTQNECTKGMFESLKDLRTIMTNGLEVFWLALPAESMASVCQK